MASSVKISLFVNCLATGLFGRIIFCQSSSAETSYSVLVVLSGSVLQIGLALRVAVAQKDLQQSWMAAVPSAEADLFGL